LVHSIFASETFAIKKAFKSPDSFSSASRGSPVTNGKSKKNLRTRRMRRTTNKDEQQQEEGQQRT
jgi:hypothetical protein